MSEAKTLEIVRLGAQGDGIAEGAGGAVYVPRALPGETVTAVLDGERGRLVEVVASSRERATPPCPHFGSCGGCVAQHMADQLYRGWKLDMVRSAFAHRGLEAPIEEVVTVPPGRRRRATFAAERRGAKAVLGFHEEGSHRLVDIDACPVVVTVIEKALPALREVADAVLGAGGEKVRLVVTAVSNGIDVGLLDIATALDARGHARLAEIGTGAGFVRITNGGDIVMQSAVPRLDIDGASVVLPPGAFIQATVEAELAIRSVLGEATRKSRRMADLFCGLGTFTFGLARRGRVLAIDGDKQAVEVLAAAAKAAPGVKPVETKVRDLMREPLSRTEIADFDAVVLDPPRAGAKAQCEAVARAKVPLVCLVSCNPATLARDCRILVDAGYAIERVVPVDQFVWSPHVEAVAVLRRGVR